MKLDHSRDFFISSLAFIAWGAVQYFGIADAKSLMWLSLEPRLLWNGAVLCLGAYLLINSWLMSFSVEVEGGIFRVCRPVVGVREYRDDQIAWVWSPTARTSVAKIVGGPFVPMAAVNFSERQVLASIVSALRDK